MKLYKVLFLLLITLSVASISHAQTNQTLLLQNSNGKLFRYGYEGILTTADSGAHTIATFPIGTNEAGVLRARVVGLDTAGANGVTGILSIRYKKAAGTLTLGSPIVNSAIVTDAGISGATFAFDTLAHNVIIKVTGDTATHVRWIADVEWTKVTK